LSALTRPTLAEFVACCDAEFEFLVREYGFARSPSPMEYNEFSVRFRKGALGVDVYGENWGEAASCDLLRGSDRLYLGMLLPVAQGDTQKRKRARPGHLAQVHDIASRLKLHASDFLRGDLVRFDAALAEWRRVTQPRPVTREQIMERKRQTAVALAGHASRRGDYAEVVRLLQPYAEELSPRQRRMLENARAAKARHE
jgi:hypothetical protein